jgi:hypothetical protein
MKHAPEPPMTWTYAYELVPQAENRLRSIMTLLDVGQAAARREHRIWSCNVVRAQLVTHILVVSDSSDQEGDINRQVEMELAKLGVRFSRTASLLVAGAAPPSPV